MRTLATYPEWRLMQGVSRTSVSSDAIACHTRSPGSDTNCFGSFGRPGAPMFAGAGRRPMKKGRFVTSAPFFTQASCYTSVASGLDEHLFRLAFLDRAADQMIERAQGCLRALADRDHDLLERHR